MKSNPSDYAIIYQIKLCILKNLTGAFYRTLNVENLFKTNHLYKNLCGTILEM